jgi:hypothetical protein
MSRHKGSISRKPTIGNARYRCWQAMRSLKTFEIPQVIAVSEASRANVQKYVRGLEKNGYLIRTRERESGRKSGNAMFRLAGNFGPLPPRVHADWTLFDPNLETVAG